MDPKAQAILEALSHALGNCHVDYQFANDLHKFRPDWGPTHWLYVARTFVEDHSEVELLASLASWRVLDAFRESQQSRWLFVGEGSIREVDDVFGRGREL